MLYETPVYPSIADTTIEVHRGLSVREHYAGLAMQSLIVKGAYLYTGDLCESTAHLAICYADALIDKLTEYEEAAAEEGTTPSEET